MKSFKIKIKQANFLHQGRLDRLEPHARNKTKVYLSICITVILLEGGMCDILQVLVPVDSERSVEDMILHVYKMKGHRSICKNP